MSFQLPTHVTVADGSVVGRVTGCSRCQLAGCCGTRIHVTWPDGKRTRPCGRGMHEVPGLDGVRVWSVHKVESPKALKLLQKWNAQRLAVDKAAGNKNLYYIQDKRSIVGNNLLWYRKGGHGYTCSIDEAEVFTQGEAVELVTNGSDKYRAWDKVYIDSVVSRTVDKQRLEPGRDGIQKDGPYADSSAH